MDSPIWGITTSVPGPADAGGFPCVAGGASTAAGVTVSAAGAAAVSAFADAEEEAPSEMVQTTELT